MAHSKVELTVIEDIDDAKRYGAKIEKGALVNMKLWSVWGYYNEICSLYNNISS